MGKTGHLGREGEELAVSFLQERGVVPLERNWRFRKAEIDIVAREGDTLVFVEVKTRSRLDFGTPEDFVSAAQQKRLIAAATAYMEQSGHEGEVRFDVLSIYWPEGYPPQVKHLRDAFFPGLG